ncbi:Pkinase-domain-containing protein [Obba rivulosa]|uniref:Pkinase-domain-containing protein n=1 Tax=Obba rivulosa TaxID=1052685 RepID=A0A8E2J2M0_9APHY|nr:Pkinase-domain-containing protein [Obba rivulosa]
MVALNLHRKCKRPIADLTGQYIGHGSARIQLLKALGAGAYGAVYTARSASDKDLPPVDYAVKVLLKADERNPRRKDSQRQEVEFHDQMSAHPNVITFHGAMQDEHYIYLIMDHCPGGDLFRLIARDRVLARNDALIKRLFLQIIDAVETCHASSIFHRDLKPDNILVSEDLSQVYLTDFGLSTEDSFSHKFGVGSPLYMSPEQCVRTPRDRRCRDTQLCDTRRCDVWALALILMNMVCGRVPWMEANVRDARFLLYTRRPNFLREMLPISKGANEIFKRMLTLDPEEAVDLYTLRGLVQNLKTFYMSEEEVRAVGGHVEQIWNFYSPKNSTRTPGVPPGGKGAPSTTSNSLEDDSDDSDERLAGINSSMLDMTERGQFVKEQPASCADKRSICAASEANTSTTAVESITPVTSKKHPRVDLPAPDYGLDLDWAPATPWRLAGLPEPEPPKVKEFRSSAGMRLLRRLLGSLIAV